MKSKIRILPLDIVMFETLSKGRLHGDVGRAPVRVVADAVHNGLRGLSLQRKCLVEGAELESILRKPVHGVLLRPHLKQPGSHGTVDAMLKIH